MKILMFDRKKGILKVRPEGPADLIALAKVIKTGMIAKSWSTRSVAIDHGGKRERVRKKVWVEIEVEKKELKEGELRLTGRVLNEGEFLQKGSYHSLEVRDSDLILVGRFTEAEIKYLRRFEKRVEDIVVVLIDEREAQVYVVDDRARKVAEFHSSHAKESGEGSRIEKEVAPLLRKLYNGRLIIAGPGFKKEALAKELEGMRFVMDSTSHTGPAGLREVFSRRLIEKVEKGLRIAKEAELVERFFREIARGGLVVYGREKTEEAIGMGAVEMLIISDDFLGDEIIEKAEEMGSKVEIISSSHEAGKRFRQFGGIGGFLRYKYWTE